MAAQTDILMYLALPKNQVAAECQARLNPSDGLLNDFQAGCFFEAEDMRLGLTLVGREGGRGGVDYTFWHDHQPAAGAQPPRFSIEADALSVTRLIDTASPVLMQYCLSQERLDRAVLVKRQLVGGTSPLGFLRFELSDVTVRSVGWSDGHAVRETCTFGYQGLAMTFLPRKPSGAALPEQQGSWISETMKKDAAARLRASLASAGARGARSR